MSLVILPYFISKLNLLLIHYFYHIGNPNKTISRNIIGTRITIMIITMTNFAHKKGIIRDARGLNVKIRTTNLKFMSVLSQPINKITLG